MLPKVLAEELLHYSCLREAKMRVSGVKLKSSLVLSIL